MLSWAVEAAIEAEVGEVVVVTGGEGVEGLLPEGAVALANPHWERGQAGSLQVAVAHARAAGHDDLVVGLGDTPLVPAAAWRAVADCRATPVAVADYDGARRPPVRLHREVWDLLPRTGDHGARELLRARPDLVTAVPCAGDPADVDTREDLDRWS